MRGSRVKDGAVSKPATGTIASATRAFREKRRVRIKCALDIVQAERLSSLQLAVRFNKRLPTNAPLNRGAPWLSPRISHPAANHLRNIATPYDRSNVRELEHWATVSNRLRKLARSRL